MSEFKEIAKKIKDFRDQRDWAQFHNHKDMALSLVLEAAEVLEHFQWKTLEETNRHVETHKEELGDELADVAMYLIELADNVGIDLPAAIEAKMIKNAKKYPVQKSRGKHTKYTRL